MDTLLFCTLTLIIGTGLFWSIVYILIIKQGFRDKSYGMPMVALCANISWEFIFSFIYPHAGWVRAIDVVWFSLDVILLLQFLLFGGADFKKLFPSKLFYPTFLFTLILCFFTILLVTKEFNDYLGRYAAFSQNFMMSILFILLLLRRNSISGQSMYIAIFKMIGSLMASVLFFMFLPSALIIFLSAATLIFDWIYIILLYVKYHDAGRNPWRIVAKPM